MLTNIYPEMRVAPTLYILLPSFSAVVNCSGSCAYKEYCALGPAPALECVNGRDFKDPEGDEENLFSRSISLHLLLYCLSPCFAACVHISCRFLLVMIGLALN